MHARTIVTAGLLSLGLGTALVLVPAAFRAPAATAQASAIVGICDPRTPITSLPFTVSKPGSYYVGRNLHGVAGASGIIVLCSNVTIDLCGFTLFGGPGSLSGIEALTPSTTSLYVRNGMIRDWGAAGIDANGASTSRYEDLLIASCGADGLRCGGTSQVRRCSAEGNGTSILSDGFRSSTASTLIDCLATGNSADGIGVADGCFISGCTAQGNARDGIFLSAGSTVVDSIARQNAGVGFHVPGTPCTISRCTATANGSHGIEAGDGSNVSDCAADENGGHGILLNDRTIVTHCTASRNLSAGIRTQSYCLVLENNCTSNKFGIEIINPGSRIDGNLCVANLSSGISDRAGGGFATNLIVRNTCTSNPINYDLIGSSGYGAIVTAPAPAFLSDQPWANFEYP